MAAGHSNEASTCAKTPPTFRGPQNIRSRSAVPANGRRNARILMKFAPFRGRRIDPNSNSVQMPIPKRTPISHTVAASIFEFFRPACSSSEVASPLRFAATTSRASRGRRRITGRRGTFSIARIPAGRRSVQFDPRRTGFTALLSGLILANDEL